MVWILFNRLGRRFGIVSMDGLHACIVEMIEGSWWRGNGDTRLDCWCVGTGGVGGLCSQLGKQLVAPRRFEFEFNLDDWFAQNAWRVITKIIDINNQRSFQFNDNEVLYSLGRTSMAGSIPSRGSGFASSSSPSYNHYNGEEGFGFVDSLAFSSFRWCRFQKCISDESA